VSISTGTKFRAARSSETTLNPSLPGSMMSSTMASKFSFLVKQTVGSGFAIADDFGGVAFGLAD
jgi:hypothetical protein